MRIVFRVTLLLLLSAFLLFAQTPPPSSIPQRIILNLTDQPATGIAITWRTDRQFPNSQVRYAKATDWKDFEDSALFIQAREERVQIDSLHVAFHYSGILNNLLPGTLYVYSVGHDSVWSEWSQFLTANKESCPFEFVYMGDPQNDIKAHVSRVFREAFRMAPEACFWVFAGDLISAPLYDRYWDELFYAAGFIPSIIPMVMVPGNHEYPKIDTTGVTPRRLIPLWRPHFTLPENGVKGLEETSYTFDYQGVRFIMLDGNQKLEEQIEWMKPLLANNPNVWTIAVMHQPIYSTGQHRESKKYQELFIPLFDQYSVDLVLHGHDHTYGRSYKLKNGIRVGGTERGTVYVNSVSGPKAYSINERYRDYMVLIGNHMELFQVIQINGHKLQFKAYTVTGKLYDSFELNK